MDELKLEWKKFTAFWPGGVWVSGYEARVGALALHAHHGGTWSVGMHLAWDLRLEAKTAPDLVEAMRAAEAALVAELRPYGAESQRMENWRATREARLLSWLRDREARRGVPVQNLHISIGGQKLTVPVNEQDTAADIGARLRRELPSVPAESSCPRLWVKPSAAPDDEFAPAQDRAVRRDRFVYNERLSNRRVDVFMQAGEQIAEVELRDVASRQRIGLVFRLRAETSPHNRKVRENLITAIRTAGGDGHGYLQRAGAAYRIWRDSRVTRCDE